MIWEPNFGWSNSQTYWTSDIKNYRPVMKFKLMTFCCSSKEMSLSTA
jgi:hypothetical protein